MPAATTEVSTTMLSLSLTYGPAVVTLRRTLDHREGIILSMIAKAHGSQSAVMPKNKQQVYICFSVPSGIKVFWPAYRRARAVPPHSAERDEDRTLRAVASAPPTLSPLTLSGRSVGREGEYFMEVSGHSANSTSN